MGGTIWKSEQDVNLQDQTTPAIIANFNQVQNSTTLAAEALRDTRQITVSDPTGFSIGTYVIVFSPITVRFFVAFATAVVGPLITLDRPLDSTFPIGSFVDGAITDLAVDGSVTPQLFGLRGLGAPPGINLDVDITRIIMTCVATDPVTLSLFGDLPRLTNGLLMRQRNTEWFNTFNVHSNREIAGLTFDFNVSQAINPAQGENGFVTRLTFAGQNKVGVAIRLALGEDLEILVQDALQSLLSLEIIAEGHIVD